MQLSHSVLSQYQALKFIAPLPIWFGIYFLVCILLIIRGVYLFPYKLSVFLLCTFWKDCFYSSAFSDIQKQVSVMSSNHNIAHIISFQFRARAGLCVHFLPHENIFIKEYFIKHTKLCVYYIAASQTVFKFFPTRNVLI